MGQSRNVSGPAVVLVLFAVLVGVYFLFYRAELAPPGVDLLHEHEEEGPQLPSSPSASAEDLREISSGLMPLGLMAVFPPLRDDRLVGVRIAFVVAGSPAERAGLRPGDLVKRFAGRGTTSPYGLVAALKTVQPEEEYEVVVVRAGEESTLVVTGLTPLPPEEWLR